MVTLLQRKVIAIGCKVYVTTSSQSVQSNKIYSLDKLLCTLNLGKSYPKASAVSSHTWFCWLEMWQDSTWLCKVQLHLRQTMTWQCLWENKTTKFKLKLSQWIETPQQKYIFKTALQHLPSTKTLINCSMNKLNTSNLVLSIQWQQWGRKCLHSQRCCLPYHSVFAGSPGSFYPLRDNPITAFLPKH